MSKKLMPYIARICQCCQRQDEAVLLSEWEMSRTGRSD